MDKTPLYEAHVTAGGKMVDFSGWQLPVHYGSLVDEHHTVRKAAGVFDVSHMTIVDVTGLQAQAFLSVLLCNNPDRLTDVGSALYTCMLDHRGGIIDDLIVYYMGPENYRLVVNAATREKDLAWMKACKKGTEDKADPAGTKAFDVAITERAELAMLAVQGPTARQIAEQCLPGDIGDAAKTLHRFQALQADEWFVARTGYTGEDGYEIALPADAAEGFWKDLLDAGCVPCGLGARDTLRLEAGMNLYGQDMDESETPLTSGLGWTVEWSPEDRNFNGRRALVAQKASGVPAKLCGLVLDGKGVLRSGQTLFCGDREIGKITSGTYSPTLQKSIAFGRIDSDIADAADGKVEVLIRKNKLPVIRSRRVFVRNGKPATA